MTLSIYLGTPTSPHLPPPPTRYPLVTKVIQLKANPNSDDSNGTTVDPYIVIPVQPLDNKDKSSLLRDYKTYPIGKEDARALYYETKRPLYGKLLQDKTVCEEQVLMRMFFNMNTISSLDDLPPEYIGKRLHDPESKEFLRRRFKDKNNILDEELPDNVIAVIRNLKGDVVEDLWWKMRQGRYQMSRIRANIGMITAYMEKSPSKTLAVFYYLRDIVDNTYSVSDTMDHIRTFPTTTDDRDSACKSFLRSVFKIPDDGTVVELPPEVKAEIDQCTYETLREVVDQIRDLNGYIVCSIHVLSALLGCNTAAYMLGSASQAVAVFFYLQDYVVKDSTPLVQSISVFAAAMDHIKEFPSKADDREENESKRDALHYVQRIVNSMSGAMEIPAEMAAAYCVGLESSVTSHNTVLIFGYANESQANASINFKNEDQIVYVDEEEADVDDSEDHLHGREEEGAVYGFVTTNPFFAYHHHDELTEDTKEEDTLQGSKDVSSTPIITDNPSEDLFAPHAHLPESIDDVDQGKQTHGGATVFTNELGVKVPVSDWTLYSNRHEVFRLYSIVEYLSLVKTVKMKFEREDLDREEMRRVEASINKYHFFDFNSYDVDDVYLRLGRVYFSSNTTNYSTKDLCEKLMQLKVHFLQEELDDTYEEDIEAGDPDEAEGMTSRNAFTVKLMIFKSSADETR